MLEHLGSYLLVRSYFSQPCIDLLTYVQCMLLKIGSVSCAGYLYPSDSIIRVYILFIKPLFTQLSIDCFLKSFTWVAYIWKC